MRHKLTALVALGSALLVLAIGTPALAATFVTPPDKTSSVAVSNEVKDDVFLVGNTATLAAPISGELFAAGNSVNVGNTVGRSIVAVGATVSVDQGSGYNAFVAGNTVTLSGTFGHDVYVVGNSVVIKEGTLIDGDLRVAASDLTLYGKVRGSVYIAGQRVTSNAVIEGSLIAKNADFTFTGGSIGKNFTYTAAKDATGLDKVVIIGKTERTAPETGASAWVVAVWSFFMAIIGTLVLTLLLVFVAGKRIESIHDVVRKDWTTSFVRGLAFLVIMPVLIIAGFLILIGWQVAILVALLYVLVLMLAGAVSYAVFGKWLLAQLKSPSPALWWAALVGVVILTLMVAVPWIGWILGSIYNFGIFIPVVGAMVSKVFVRARG